MSQEAESLQELVEFIVSEIVSHPDAVEVSHVEGQETDVLEIRVDPDDLGKLIGRHGRTAKALRSLVNVAAQKRSRRAILEIME